MLNMTVLAPRKKGKKLTRRTSNLDSILYEEGVNNIDKEMMKKAIYINSIAL